MSASNRLLIKGGHLVTGDPALGVIIDGQMLIEDGKIVAIGRNLSVDDAEIIDAGGQVVAPGTVDTHRHTWQSQLRGFIPDLSLQQYIFGFWPTATEANMPEDVLLANRLGALDALNKGVTTILDYSHITNSPEHADAGVDGLEQSGIRAVYAYGQRQSNPMAPATFDRMADFSRIAKERFSSPNLVTLGMALSEIGLTPTSVIAQQKRLANTVSAVATAHVGSNWQLPSGIPELSAAGILDDRLILAHANTFTDTDWTIADSHGVKVSTSPVTEPNMGMGRLAINAIMRHWILPTVAVDVVSLAAGDVLGAARLALAFARWADAEPTTLTERDVAIIDISAADALRWATINGADALGLADTVGTLTVGKDADIIIVGGDEPSSRPINDPIAQLIFQTGSGQVDTVLVQGNIRKLHGKLAGVDLTALVAELEQSADRVEQRMAKITAARNAPDPEMMAGFPHWVAANLAT